MPRQGDEQPVQREITPGIGQWQWSDGTPLTQDEVDSFGLRNAGNLGNTFEDIGSALGFVPNVVDQSAPGASLQTAQANAQRNKEGDFISALQQQAATGDGAWQQRFAEAVNQTKAAAQALGQSDSNVGYGSALRNIGNAQAAADQRAVGDSEILRAQSKLDARNQLGDVLGSRAQMDIGQSTEEARIERERRAANQASIDQSAQNRKNTEKGIASIFGFGGAAGMGMSDGGEVPGRAQVFGNDERNDTKPAMLSPGEIVIPRDIAMAPDAPEQAARFVAAVKAGHDPQRGSNPAKMAEGGGIRPVSQQERGGAGVDAANVFAPHIGRNILYKNLRDKAGAGGGGTIDESMYRDTANQQNQLAALFAGQATGSGPTIVPFVTQRRMDDTLGAAQAQQVRGGAPAGDVVQAASAAGSEAAMGAGAQAGREQSEGQRSFGNAVRQMRGQEMQLASAQQQAGWQKTLADLGLSLAQQAELRGALGAAGQGAAAFAGMGKDKSGGNLTALSNNPYPEDTGYNNPYPGESADQWAQYEPEEQGSGLKSGMAYGGVVGMAKGGKVEGKYPRMPKPKDKSDVKLELGELQMETAEERDAREYEEETGMTKPAKRTKKEHESAFSRAVRGVSDFARKASAAVGMADGGGVSHLWGGGFPDAGGYKSYDPYAMPPRKDSGPVVYVSPTPVPGTQPVSLGGAGGGAGGGSEPPTSGAGGGTSMGDYGATGVGGASGSTRADRGSGGATGGPSDNQIPQHESIQPRAERPPVSPALPAGVMPKGAAPPVPPPAKPEAAHKPAGGGTSRPTGAGADEFARKAAMAGYEAENQANVNSAETAAAEANALETQMNERKAVVARTQAKVAEAQTRYQRAVDEMARVDTSVDPGRFWATRSTGDKVIGILGLVLGALGAGPDGVNRAANMLNDAVNRDLEAQKAEHELRLKKGGAKVGAAQNFYSMAREMAGDEVGAMDLAHAAALQNVAAKGKILMAQTRDQRAKAQLAGTLAAIEQGAAQRAAAAWEHSANRQLEREKIAASHTKDTTAAKDLRHAVAQNASIEQMVGDLKGLIGDTNIVTEKVGARAGRMQSIAGQLVTKIKEQEKLGAYDKGTAELAEQIIGDPTATFTLDSTKIAKLDEVLQRSRSDVRNLAGAIQ